MIKSEPKYDTDEVTLGYLRKVLNSLNENADILKESIEKEMNKNYGRQPIPPYKEGDTWTTVNYIYRCIKSRDIGSFNMSDWVIIYDKKRNDLMSDNFLFLSEVDLKEQIDGKIESYYMTDDPSNDWLLTTDKSLHVGDFWRKEEDSILTDYIYTQIATNPVSYNWIETNLPIIVYNTITNKKTIFLELPINYKKDDLLKISTEEQSSLFENVEIGDFLICIKDNDKFDVADWQKLNDELSLKSVESYYLRITEVKKEIENLNEIIKKDIKETENSMTLFVEQTYTTKTTTQELTEKVDANGNIISSILGETSEEVPFKSLAALTLDLANIVSIVSKKVGDDEIISKINQTAESIQITASRLALEGYTTINGTFTVDEEGNVTIANGNVIINKEGIKLSNGASLISEKGLITNLQFSSLGKYQNFDFLGYNIGGFDSSNKYIFCYSFVTLDFTIPENFVIKTAQVVLYHTPIQFYDNNNKTVNGYARNIKLYNTDKDNNFKYVMGFGSEYEYNTANLKLTEIPNAFGSSSYTPSNHSGTTIEKKVSINLKDYLSAGHNKLVIRTGDSIPANNASDNTICQKTGMARADLFITGYMKFDEI